MPQVCSSRPVGGQVQGCVHANGITYTIPVYTYVIDLFLDVVFYHVEFYFVLARVWQTLA